eukprot:1253207-Alexandrium_andersonii.AAC.1
MVLRPWTLRPFALGPRAGSGAGNSPACSFPVRPHLTASMPWPFARHGRLRGPRPRSRAC